MAEKRTINIDINNNADEAAKDFENFAKATDVANDSVEGLNKTFEQANGDIQPLTARMGEAEDRLYELAAAGDTTSKEYQGLLNKVGEYRKVQIQTDLAVDQAAGTLSQKLGGALTGATSGFAAVQGVMALTGGESEALEKSLLKVQGAMAIQQGVQGILDYSKSVGLASKATKVFNAILSLNPLALLGTALVGVIGYITLFTDAIDKALGYWNDFTDFIGVTNHAEEELNEERAERAQEELRRIENERKQREQAFNQRQSEFDREISLNQALGKSTFKLTQEKIKASIEYQKEKVKEIQLELEAYEIVFQGRNDALTRASGVQENISKLKETLIEANKSIADSETELKVNVINNNNEKSESFKKYSDEKKKNLEEIAKLEQEAIDKEIEEEIALQQTFDAIQRENEDRFRTEQENEVLLVQEKYDALEAMAFGNAEALEQIELAKLNELNDIKLKFADEEVAIETDKNKKIVEVEELTNRKKLELASASFTAIADLVGSFNTQNEKDAERQFKIQKAFNLAAAVTNTALAVTGALTAGGNPIKLATGAQFVEAGIAAAVGAANIVKIASSQFGQGDTGGGTQDISAPSVQAPQFNVVGDSGVNQLAQLQQQPTQAFVVSGEVTTAQALDRNRVQNATL